MRKLWLATVAAIMCMSAPGANAGTQTGIVSDLIVRASDGLIWFWLSGTAKTGSPSCSQAGWWMIRDENSVAGKQQYAMLVAAQVAGRQVTVSGMNTCNRLNGGEDVNWIQMLPDSQPMALASSQELSLAVESRPEPN